MEHSLTLAALPSLREMRRRLDCIPIIIHPSVSLSSLQDGDDMEVCMLFELPDRMQPSSLPSKESTRACCSSIRELCHSLLVLLLCIESINNMNNHNLLMI